ncbi:MAG: NAD-dependent protein deacetylase [Myxococcota bacterium]
MDTGAERFSTPASPIEESARRLADFLLRHPRLTVLTGAGCSTSSGIPDYRGEDGKWKHKEPMRYAQFTGDLRNRQRYWAQSFSGWRRISRAEPNPAHFAIAELERRGHLACLITQNVDTLHQRAGSRQVIDLHGVLERVRCLQCDRVIRRDRFQEQLRRANPSWVAAVRSHAPDGDVRITRSDFSAFVVPDCVECSGILKPDVVFFGESVPKARVNAAYRHVDESDALLIVGSSLMVYSGYRFAVAAGKAGKPIAIINRGKSRADDLATYRVSADCAEILPRTNELLRSSIG